VLSFLGNVFSEDRVFFVPYELLTINPELFLRCCLVDTGVATLEQVEGLGLPRKDNVNRRGDGAHNLRDVSRLSRLINHLSIYKGS